MGCQSSKQIQQKNSEKSSNLSLKLVSQKKECIKSQKQSPSSNQSKSTVDFKPQDESIITKIIKKKKIGMDQLNAKSAQKQQLGLQFGKKLINNKFSSPDILSPKVLQTLEKNMIQYYNLQGDNMNYSPNINIKDCQIREKSQTQNKQKRVKYTELLENLQLKKFQIKQEYDLFISPRNQQEQSEKISNFLQNLSKLMHPTLQSGQYIEYLYQQNDKINNKFQCFLNKNIQQSFIMRKRNIFKVNFSKRQNIQRSQTTALQSQSEQQNCDSEKKEYQFQLQKQQKQEEKKS